MRSPRPPRIFTIVCAVLANTLVFLALAYFLVGRADMPSYFPHAASRSSDPNAADIPFGIFLLGLAGLAFYGAIQSHLHRSWMRSRRWHRKHGRL
jgi:hypothetical protein